MIPRANLKRGQHLITLRTTRLGSCSGPDLPMRSEDATRAPPRTGRPRPRGSRCDFLALAGLCCSGRCCCCLRQRSPEASLSFLSRPTSCVYRPFSFPRFFLSATNSPSKQASLPSSYNLHLRYPSTQVPTQTPTVKMRAAALLALAAAAVKAQSGPPEYSSSLNMTIDPNSVEDSTRGEPGRHPTACPPLY